MSIHVSETAKMRAVGREWAWYKPTPIFTASSVMAATSTEINNQRTKDCPRNRVGTLDQLGTQASVRRAVKSSGPKPRKSRRKTGGHAPGSRGEADFSRGLCRSAQNSRHPWLSWGYSERCSVEYHHGASITLLSSRKTPHQQLPTCELTTTLITFHRLQTTRSCYNLGRELPMAYCNHRGL